MWVFFLKNFLMENWLLLELSPFDVFTIFFKGEESNLVGPLHLFDNHRTFM